MIRMEQPSFSFNSCDVGWPHYKMWMTMVGRKGMTAAELGGRIFAANMASVRSVRSPLRNVIINTHGYAGGLNIGGLTERPMEKKDLGVFGILKPLNIGPIWLVSCNAASGAAGKSFCQSLATIAGTRVIASEASQIVTKPQGIQLVLAWCRWNVDDFEGTVCDFTPTGGVRKVIDPSTDDMIMTVREPG